MGWRAIALGLVGSLLLLGEAVAGPVVDCTLTQDTAYVNGQPESIDLVTFEGKKVWKGMVDPLYVMWMSALADGVQLQLASGFRDMSEQTWLYDCYQAKKASGVCSCLEIECNEAGVPGTSKHQSGHAVDITTGCKQGWSDAKCSAFSPVFTWLKAHGGSFGFERTVASEPWHWEYWAGGPGGGVCFANCAPGCQPPSDLDVDPASLMNQGWIGGLCDTVAACGYTGALCFKQGAGFNQGMCSQGCTKYCPDKAGMATTFCVDKDDLGLATPEGVCVAKCSPGGGANGCRPGYNCAERSRYNEPATTAFVCVPGSLPQLQLPPKGWSLGYSTGNCASQLCDLAEGLACTESLAAGGTCVPALCLHPTTHKLLEGKGCSSIYVPQGTAVQCDGNGNLLAYEHCTPQAPCNACGGCGSAPLEVCDGLDNDCDGATDEGVTNACGGCGSAPLEVCDGLDNDCDGATDEGVTNACGGCGSAPLEVCDGLDNDCDGATDEDVTNACGGCGSVPLEVCDGLDNDCDGAIDEDVTNACGGCGSAPLEVCDGLDNDCDGQTDEEDVCGGDDVGEPDAGSVDTGAGDSSGSPSVWVSAPNTGVLKQRGQRQGRGACAGGRSSDPWMLFFAGFSWVLFGVRRARVRARERR